MGSEGLFFSLKWKLAILFASFFLLLLITFSYFSFQNAKANFEIDRKNLNANHVNIIETLTEDSFLVLEQFAELVSLMNLQEQNANNYFKGIVSNVDDRWSRWQLIWDIENINFFDKSGRLVKFWGEPLADLNGGVQSVLKNEIPENKIICPDTCLQQVIIPIMGQSEIIGALSITRSFSDVLIKYRNATKSDVGTLIERQNESKKLSSRAYKAWNYELIGMTSPEINIELFSYFSKYYTREDFLNPGKRIEYKNSVYEVHLLPIQQKSSSKNPPYYLLVDNITTDILHLNSDLKRIWLYSGLGMFVALFAIWASLHFFLRRITTLSKALPLLSLKKFDDFRKQIPSSERGSGYDELDKLGQTALNLSYQLESLEQNVRGQTFTLLEKSQELAKERDFVRQLIDLAPIIIIIQELNGIILSINLSGLEALEAESNAILGKVFDVFIPETDTEHLNKLNRLRNADYDELIQQDGQLVTESGKTRDISWVHKRINLKEYENDEVILTLGIDISERKVAEARNIRMAYYDYLTGLGNRRKFHEEFVQQLATAERYEYHLALLYMDLDRFKEINDTSGHEAGDNFLKMVANILKSAIRSTDLLCRLGGDEFTILMPYADIDGLDHIANKINSVLKTQVFTYSGKSFKPSASIGISIFPLHGNTVNELIANADLAMYRAKELGRGQYHLFDLEYDYRSKSNQMVHWRRVLEDAIANDKFLLVYQPILDIRTNQVSHYECLVRLQLDDGQLASPAEFVHRAEDLGMIGKIDTIVLEKALQQHIEFNRQGKNYKLSVNVSKRSFEEPMIFQDFSRLFENPEVDQSRIVFEITDTSSVSNIQSTHVLINKIKDLGCVLALNDFGVEYPSLHYLKTAPVDYVKIDGSLVRQIDKNNDDKAFVKALTEVAQAFGKKTVAEFVENEDILAILKEFGIDYAQGYYIGRPKQLD